ncbi:toxin-antitoxin system HicB family antitoxin [Aestuariimicrobium soli]|uniref:toxin-antitoxin system HicB family antitoxin n=1 Tax=Aestuariimicrobium soli TaxID=2035834 RepID=UPI003EBC19FA
MELAPHVEALRRDLANAASLGNDEAQAAAARLLVALDPSVRLTLVDLLATAAAELSATLGDTVVEVRMAGRDPHFAVTRTGTEIPHQPVVDDEDSSLTRITVRLPESLKNRADEAANGLGQSLNTWITDAVRQALTPRTNHHPGRRMTGWV